VTLALLLRHASAGDPSAWSGEDALRPLDTLGRVQAAGLPEALARFPVARILSSPAVRCVETVAPLALHHSISVERRPELAEGADPADALGVVRVAGEGAVLCTHGDILHALTGLEPPKGAALVAEHGPESLAVLELVPPPAEGWS
jgi:8-oxo-dGTP diphosphatase